MFQFRRFPTYDYFIHHRLTDLHLPGCPIRISPDITLAYSSPRLFAVNRVLLRLPVPRHSPCALCSLTSFYYACSLYLPLSLTPTVKPTDYVGPVTENLFSANRYRETISHLTVPLQKTSSLPAGTNLCRRAGAPRIRPCVKLCDSLNLRCLSFFTRSIIV